MVQNPDPTTPCMKCGHEWCRGDFHDDDMCWFYQEAQLQDRGKYPRRKSSCHNEYVAIVMLQWQEIAGDDYDGFPFRENFSDEQLEKFDDDAFGDKHVD